MAKKMQRKHIFFFSKTTWFILFWCLLAIGFYLWIFVEPYTLWSPDIARPNATLSQLHFDKPYHVYFKAYEKKTGKVWPEDIYRKSTSGALQKIHPVDIDAVDFVFSNQLQQLVLLGWGKATITNPAGITLKTVVFPSGLHYENDSFLMDAWGVSIILGLHPNGSYLKTESYVLQLVDQTITPSAVPLPQKDYSKRPYLKSPDGKYTVHIDKSGSVFIDGKEYIHSAGRDRGWKQANIIGCFEPQWFSDSNHVLLTCAGDQLRILEVSTHKQAIFANGFSQQIAQ